MHSVIPVTSIVDRHLSITASQAEQADGVIKNGVVEAVIGDLSSMRQLKNQKEFKNDTKSSRNEKVF